MRQIVIFNGPPGSGKDTCADYLANRHYYYGMKLADPLKLITHAAYGLWPIPNNQYESSKEDPSPDFFGKTPRAAYIEMSEEAIKPHYGEEWWAHVLVNRINRETAERIVLSDCGFPAELKVLSEAFGPENITLFRLHREGRDFSKDSRSYLYPEEPHIRQVDLDNNGTKEQVFNRIKEVLESKPDELEFFAPAVSLAGLELPCNDSPELE